MKKIYSFFLFVVLSPFLNTTPSYSQTFTNPFIHPGNIYNNIQYSKYVFGQVGHQIIQNQLEGSFGMTWIDGEPYYLVNFTPELGFSKFGVGLDISLRINRKGKIRAEDFNESYDYARMIRYVRYGEKGDDFYARLGLLDYARLGHGLILYLYKNSPSYDDRRIGAEFDWKLGSYGFETVYGDFARAGVFGIRTFTKPLKLTSLSDVPVISDMEAGATIAGDMRYNAMGESIDSAGKKNGKGQLAIMGFDLGFPLLRIPSVSSTFYVDYAKIFSFGSGASIGIDFDVHGGSIVDVLTKIERRYIGDKFLANYFDAFYEIDRLDKIKFLDSLISPGPGLFGDMTINILSTLLVHGTYQHLDEQPRSGLMHFATSSGDIIPIGVVEAGYDKKFIKDFQDVFTLDERSLLYSSIGYKPYPYMTVAMVYIWTFEKDKKGIYQPQRRVETQVSFSYPLGK